MSATLDDVLAELKALRAEVAELRAKVSDPTLRGVVTLARHLGAVPSKGGASSSGGGSSGNNPVQRAEPATDAALDAVDGDPQVKFDPKKWRSAGNESMKGRALSTCPADFLDEYAAQNEWSAANPQEGKERFAPQNMKTASLARGWAARRRKEAQDVPPPAAEEHEEDFQ